MFYYFIILVTKLNLIKFESFTIFIFNFCLSFLSTNKYFFRWKYCIPLMSYFLF
eukprot:UN19674